MPKDSDMFKAGTEKDGTLNNIAITAMIMVYL